MRFASLGAEPTPMSPEQFKARLTGDTAVLSNVIRETGLRIE